MSGNSTHRTYRTLGELGSERLGPYAYPRYYLTRVNSLADDPQDPSYAHGDGVSNCKYLSHCRHSMT